MENRCLTQVTDLVFDDLMTTAEIVLQIRSPNLNLET